VQSIGKGDGRSPKEKMGTGYAVTGCEGIYPTVRSELMFLLYKNPDTP